MKKIYIIIGLIIAIALAVYFTGLYTYFMTTEIQEPMPTVSAGAQIQEPTTLAIGTFKDIDFIHKGSGIAKLIKNGNQHIVRFENFNVTNGPALRVYLSRSTEPTGDLKSLGDYIDLGSLKGNIGNQNYDIPANASEYRTVIIWCQKFGVLFSYAVMQ